MRGIVLVGLLAACAGGGTKPAELEVRAPDVFKVDPSWGLALSLTQGLSTTTWAFASSVELTCEELVADLEEASAIWADHEAAIAEGTDYATLGTLSEGTYGALADLYDDFEKEDGAVTSVAVRTEVNSGPDGAWYSGDTNPYPVIEEGWQTYNAGGARPVPEEEAQGPVYGTVALECAEDLCTLALQGAEVRSRAGEVDDKLGDLAMDGSELPLCAMELPEGQEPIFPYIVPWTN